MKIGVVGTRGGWSSERLADTVERLTGFRLLINMNEVRLDLNTGKVWFKNTDLTQLDGLIIKKIGAWYSPHLMDRLEILRFLNEQGLPIFSSPLSIMRVLDRLSCTVTLRCGNIPMPPTTITENIEQALETVETYGEAVFKPLYSSKARGMCVIKPGSDTRSRIEEFCSEHPIMYLQQKIDLGGKDLGIVFLGGEYMTTYARCNTGTSWNTTTVSGGKYAPYRPSKESIDLASRAQSLFNLDFTCVDVVETGDGPVISKSRLSAASEAFSRHAASMQQSVTPVTP